MKRAKLTDRPFEIFDGDIFQIGMTSGGHRVYACEDGFRKVKIRDGVRVKDEYDYTPIVAFRCCATQNDPKSLFAHEQMGAKCGELDDYTTDYLYKWLKIGNIYDNPELLLGLDLKRKGEKKWKEENE